MIGRGISQIITRVQHRELENFYKNWKLFVDYKNNIKRSFVQLKMKKNVDLLTKCLKSIYLTAHIGDEAMQSNFRALTS